MTGVKEGETGEGKSIGADYCMLHECEQAPTAQVTIFCFSWSPRCLLFCCVYHITAHWSKLPMFALFTIGLTLSVWKLTPSALSIRECR